MKKNSQKPRYNDTFTQKFPKGVVYLGKGVVFKIIKKSETRYDVEGWEGKNYFVNTLFLLDALAITLKKYKTWNSPPIEIICYGFEPEKSDKEWLTLCIIKSMIELIERS